MVRHLPKYLLLTRAIPLGLACGLAIAVPAQSQRPEAPSTIPGTVTDSIEPRARRPQADSLIADRRRALDSMREAARRASAGATRRSPLDGNPPFYGYTLAFYGNILGGAIIGLVAFLLRQRAAAGTVRRWWGVAGVLSGAIVGAVVFLPIFMFFAMLSVAFSPLPPVMMFAMALLATVFVIAWLTTCRYRRSR